MVKNLAAKEGDTGNTSLIPGLEDPPDFIKQITSKKFPR